MRASTINSLSGYENVNRLAGYRSFINQIVSFFAVGIALYGLAQLYQWLSHDPIIKHTIKCKYCRKRINEKVGEPDSLLTGSLLIRGVEPSLCELHQLARRQGRLKPRSALNFLLQRALSEAPVGPSTLAFGAYQLHSLALLPRYPKYRCIVASMLYNPRD